MYNKKSVSVVIATYREKNSIKVVTENFFKTKLVDEVIVVNNNAEKGTNAEVKKTKAKIINEKKQGQGYALRRGIKNTKGHYIVLCEGDGTFDPDDIKKFLAYAEDFPVVLGTRTNRSLIATDSAMSFFRRLADIFEGRLIEFLFLSGSITDVGCTYKLLRREVLGDLDTESLKGDSHFVTDLTLQVVARRIPFIEIPVAFRKRVGESSVTGNFYDMTKWGIKLFVFIVYFWLKWRIIQLMQFLRLRKFRDNISI